MWSLSARFWTTGTLVSRREWTEGGSLARLTLGTDGVWSSHYGQRHGSGLGGKVPGAATTARSSTGTQDEIQHQGRRTGLEEGSEEATPQLFPPKSSHCAIHANNRRPF